VFRVRAENGANAHAHGLSASLERLSKGKKSNVTAAAGWGRGFSGKDSP
jgi:hypothetical protein